MAFVFTDSTSATIIQCCKSMVYYLIIIARGFICYLAEIYYLVDIILLGRLIICKHMITCAILFANITGGNFTT